METQQGSAALRVTLHRDPESIGELDVLQQYVYVASGCNVVLDFAAVEVFRSQMVIGLLVLDTLLRQSGRTLAICSVRPSVEATFGQLGLAHLFGLGGHSSDISTHAHLPVCGD
jgi:anti-anti-sigma regulatory factor